MRLWRTTKHENRVQRAGYAETGQSVIQASVVGDCLKVGSLCDDTDPADKTDPRRQRYHLLSHPETGRTHDSVCTRPAAQQSPPTEALCKLWLNVVVDWTYIRPR